MLCNACYSCNSQASNELAVEEAVDAGVPAGRARGGVCDRADPARMGGAERERWCGLLRIRLAGGAARFVKKLDRFFGFDGVHNEVMLEPPYAYHYAGRPDRSAEIVRAVMRHHFADSPRRTARQRRLRARCAPGTCGTRWDSFPVPGQGIFLLGSPRVERAELTAGAGGAGSLQGSGRPRRTVYLHAVRLNGESPWTGTG